MTELHFGVDASSAQRRVDWARVDESTAFGWEKVTEGTGYVNPYWADAKAQMIARKKATGFVPGAYHFLQHGNAPAQVQHFAEIAGDLSEFGIAFDVEPEPSLGSFPTLADVLAAVHEARILFPKHPIGGYIAPWYWGAQSTSMVDWRWPSRYITGIGSPQALYPRVPASFWDNYPDGGRADLLQFTSTAIVEGAVSASGVVDASAYRGTMAQYAAMVLPAVDPPPPPPVKRDTMQLVLPELKAGSTMHSDVRRAQALLCEAGPAVAIDGVFGPATAAAVAHVQRAHGLVVDETVGPHTWAVLVTGRDL